MGISVLFSLGLVVAVLLAAAGIIFYLRSNARQARYRREHRDGETFAKYESILEEIRRQPADPALQMEAFLLGRTILSETSIRHDIDEALRLGGKLTSAEAAGEFEAFRPLRDED